MKNFLLTLSLIAIGVSTVQAASPTIITDYDWGRKVSKEKGKPLILLFYGTW